MTELSAGMNPEKLSYKQCVSFLKKTLADLENANLIAKPENIQEPDWRFIILASTYLLFEGKYDPGLFQSWLVDGYDDQQIDLITSMTSDNVLHIKVVQIKNEKSFSDKTLQMIDMGLNYLFKAPQRNYSKLTNPQLVSRISEIRNLKKQHNKINVEIYYVTQANTGGKELPNLVIREQAELKSKWHTEFNSFDVRLLGAQDIVANIIGATFKVPEHSVDLNIEKCSSPNRNCIEYEGVNRNKKALVVSINATELATVVSPIKSWVFNENVRVFLGRKKNSINDTIYQSCTHPANSGDFWFLNNGITFTCKNYYLNLDPDQPNVKLDSPQIVNGCQTTMSLLKAYEKGELNANTSLLVRILETEDSLLVDQITTATNSQNSVKLRDLRSNDMLQRALKLEMQKLNRYFETKAGEYKVLDRREKSKIISNEKCGQACLAVKLKHPSVALSSKSSIWQNNQPGYTEVFTNTALDLLFCVELHRYCLAKQRRSRKQVIRKPLEKAITKYATYHLARIMAYLLCKDKFDEPIISKKINDVVSSSANIDKAYKRARIILKQAIRNVSPLLIPNYMNVLKNSGIDSEIDRILYSS